VAAKPWAGALPEAHGKVAAGSQGVDWTVPWLAPLRAHGPGWEALSQSDPVAWRAAMTTSAARRGLRTGRARALRFVAQEDLADGRAYETHIARTGDVPTRANLHDLFNALIWLRFPRTKAALNALQAAAIDATGVQARRGGLRDALTLFDENAVLLVCCDAAIVAALRAFEWRALFVERRAAWGRHCECLLFGHALAEKLVRPYKAVTAHAWVVEMDDAWFGMTEPSRSEALDARVARDLVRAADGLRPGIFSPLPVLGVPHWWSGNAEPAFYADAAVFRPGRRRAC
jgi:hypothetical protein